MYVATELHGQGKFFRPLCDCCYWRSRGGGGGVKKLKYWHAVNVWCISHVVRLKLPLQESSDDRGVNFGATQFGSHSFRRVVTRTCRPRQLCCLLCLVLDTYVGPFASSWTIVSNPKDRIPCGKQGSTPYRRKRLGSYSLSLSFMYFTHFWHFPYVACFA